jgi:hypothetical protein
MKLSEEDYELKFVSFMHFDAFYKACGRELVGMRSQ